jgi:large subunit ribosomal protein L9
MSTRVILIDSVPNLGLPGDVVNVKPGYARNYLLPQGKALVATEGNVAEAAHQKRIAESRRKKIIQSLSELRDRLAGTRLSFSEKVSEAGRLYGSVTGRRIAEALQADYAELQAGWVRLAEPIKAPGEFTVALELAPGLTASIVVEVIGERDAEEVAAAAAAEADDDEPSDEDGEDFDDGDAEDDVEDEATA